MTFLRGKFLVLGLFMASVLTGCGSDSDDDENGTQWGGIEYTYLDQGDLKIENNTLQGTGTILFKQPLSGGVDSGHHLNLDFTLSPDSSLIVSTYADNQLKDGIQLVFRVSAEGKLSVLLKHGETATDVSGSFMEVDVTKPVSLSIDVHNDEDPAHVLVWNGNETEFKEDTALLNSEEDGNNVPGKGKDSYWGLTLNKAQVSKTELSDAKFEE